jgi:hypothetical protein
MSIVSGEDILNAVWPVCPRCRVPMRDITLLPSYEDGERDEITCASCGRAYEIRIHLVRSYNCYPLEAKQNG